MKDFLKNKLVTVLIVVATLVLAGIAIFTAIRLYQLRQESVSPARPESAPEAATTPVYESCSTFTFKLGDTPPPVVTICDAKIAYRNNEENTPGNYNASYTDDQIIGPSGTVSPGEIIVYKIVPSPTLSENPFTITDTLSNKVEFLDADNKCNYDEDTRTVTCVDKTYRSYRVQVNESATGTIENEASINGALSPRECQLSLTIAGTPTGTPTATPTASPTPSASPTASPTPSDTPSPTPTGTATGTPGATATPTASSSATPGLAQATASPQPELPDAGIASPTIIGISVAALLLLISFALAL